MKISKLNLFIKLLFNIFLICSLPTHAMKFGVEEKNGISDYCNWRLSGEILPKDADNAAKIFKNRLNKCNQSMDWKAGKASVYLNSNGGDLGAAYVIGRLLRAYEVHTKIDKNSKCFSACVFIYLAGVERTIYPPFNQLGIHRPYFSDLGTELSLTDIKTIRARQLDTLKVYLNEMDIPLTLADVMMSIPPDSIKILEYEEFKVFRLNGTDASFEEKENAILAGRYQLSSGDYRRLYAQAIERCDIGKRFYSPLSEEDREQSACKEAILWRLSLTKYKQREISFSNQCLVEPFDHDQIFKCARKIFLAP